MDFRVGESLRGVRATIMNNGTPVDLTGKTVAGKFGINGETPVRDTDTVTVEEPKTAGIVHFDWRVSDLNVAGNGELWFAPSEGGHTGFCDKLYFTVLP
jgi:hypothetical protein